MIRQKKEPNKRDRSVEAKPIRKITVGEKRWIRDSGGSVGEMIW